MPLPLLRRALQIVPQAPVVFEGTVKAYLDPFGSYSNEELWKVQ
jgi:ABC-type multidrug transport system fused ATPase/permease subunit